MKFHGSARATVLAAAVVTEVAGLGLAVLPALAAPPPPGAPPDITITAGGDRTSNDAVSGTAGVGFRVPNASPGSCTTAADGTCRVTSPSGSRRTVTQASAPAGWYLSPDLAISRSQFDPTVVRSDYSSLTTNVPQSGIDMPPSTSGNLTSPAARSGIWAVSRDDPPEPTNCGLNVALLFDLSYSVRGHLRELQNAGIGYVDALAGTPSSVALYTLGTHAPVDNRNNSNFPLTPLTTAANVAALTNKINGYTIVTNPPQNTNWDQGLWQIASAEGPPGGPQVHYDAVIAVTDGDPTVYGPDPAPGATGITRFIDVENGTFSANALKAKSTKVVAVGVNATTATALNLRAISGPAEDDDYFISNNADLGDLLHTLALAHCSGTVNVIKLVIPASSKPDIADAVPAPGWTMHATGQTVSPPTEVTNETGALSFTTSGVREPVTVTEDVKSGYKHFPVGGKNADCTNLAGQTVPVTDAGTGPGFTVATEKGDIITCRVYNQQLAPSRVTTRLSAAGGEIPVGGSASDTATLHDVTGTPAGTVEYRYYDSLTACQSATTASPGTAPSGGTLVSKVTVTSGGVVPPSAAATFPAAGTFHWAAFYSGDASNLPAASDCATEPLVVSRAPSRVTTQLSATGGEIPVGGSVSDAATLHDVHGTPIGTVEYRYYDSLSACDTDVAAFPGTQPPGGTPVSTETVTGGIAPPSAAAMFPAAGTFYWAAFYSGGPNNLPAASNCATEPLVVTKALSRVTTQLSAVGREISVGGSARDSATLHDVTPAAGGTVEYRYYDSLSACQSATSAVPGAAPSGGTLVSTATVISGVVPPSTAPTFGAAGTFYWAAFYSGGPDNLPAASDCATEPLVVTPAESRITTEVSAANGQIPVGGSATDAAMLHDVTGTPAGTVEYRLYDSLAACQSETLPFPGTPPSGGTLVSTVDVTGGVVPPSAAHAFGAAGTFYWAAFYSGDPDNQAAASHCAAEPVVVTPAPSRVTTQLSAVGGQIAVGGSVTDAATLHDVTGTPAGTVEYRLYDSLTACQSETLPFPGTPPSGGTLVSTVDVTGGVVPPSAAHAFGAAGTFYWAAFYSGDHSNQAAASHCATEPLVVTAAPSQVTTVLTPAGGQIPVDGSVTDAATLHDVTPAAGGTVEYRYYDSPSACDSDMAAFPGTPPSGGTLVSTVDVTGGVVPPSAAHAFGAAGTFYWAAFYSGDAGDQAAASNCATEPLVVTPAASQVTTVLSAAGGQIAVDGSASDTATLHGVTGIAGGTVEYHHYDSLSACDGDVAGFPRTPPPAGTLLSTVTVIDGVAPPSAAHAFPAAGTFYWAAFYSGDPDNLPAASDCATEPLVVTPAAAQLTTHVAATGGEIPVGGATSDTADLRDVTGTAGGTVEYHLYDSLPACDTDVRGFPRTPPPGGTLVSTVTVTNGLVPPSAPPHTFPAAGTFYWAAFYSGDANNLPAASDCASEPLVVTSVPSEVTTQLSPASGVTGVGGSASDSATLHGVTGTAGGTVEYRYFDSLSACQSATSAFPPASGGTLVSTVTVTGGVVPPSAAATFGAAGTFHWAAFYSGDPSNLAAASDCATEALVVTPAASQLTTKLSATGGQIAVDRSASDAATLHGVTGTAGGTVEYRFYGSLSGCDSDVAAFPVTAPSGGTLESTATVAGGLVPPSTAHTFGAAGTVYWAAFYTGDANNQTAASGCATEALVVTPAASRLTTQLSAAGGAISVGGSASDSATLHDVTGTAGGTVEYRYYDSPSACDSDVAAFPVTAPSGGTLVSTVTVTGGVVPPSAARTFGAAGTVYWAAFYSGDPANLAAASDCATEPLVLTLAPSRVTTQLQVTGGEIPVDGSASDKTTLLGVASTAAGTVDYRFYDSLPACEGDVTGFPATAPSGGTRVSTETVTGGVVPDSAAHTFLAAGTFYWAAFYSGDAGNRAAASDCATEPLVVTPAESRVTTQLSAAAGEIAVGGSASDSATLLGVASTAGGTVEYRFYDSLSSCQMSTSAVSRASGGTLVSTVTVTGGVAASSAPHTFPVGGTYYWAAFYSGDASDGAAASDCATEPLVVTPAASRVTTQVSAASGEIAVEGSASDSATLAGVTGAAGGTVEYHLYDSLSACDTDVAAFPRTAPLGSTLVSTVTVTNGVAPPSAAHAFGAVGTFHWAAFYSGDPSNQAAASDCATEPLVVSPTPSVVLTQVSAVGREIAVGGSAHATATLNEVTKDASGTVEYRYYDSLSACKSATSAFPPPTGGTTVPPTVTVTNGVVPDSAAVTFPTAGTFWWASFYSGDSKNLHDASNCDTESLVVAPAQSRVTTQVSAGGGEIAVGGSASDAATLHDVTGTAGGTVEYRYYDSPSACDSDMAAFPGTPPSGGTLVSTVTVAGGAAPSSAAHAFGAAGTFYWAAFYSGNANNLPAASNCATEPLVVTVAPTQAPASVTVNMDWLIDGVLQHVPSHDPNFQASLSLSPLIPPDQPATWGQERFGYFIGQDIQIAVTHVVVPPGCTHTVSGQLGAHTLTQDRNEFLVTATATCDQLSPHPPPGTHLTLVKRISILFTTVEQVPLTSWTLTARRAPGEPPVISGTTGVTGNVEPHVQYVLAESKVPGYRQLTGPALLHLAPGATGSWSCVENEPGGHSGLEDFDGGDGVVVVQPGQHATCTAVNRPTRAALVGPAATGGGFAAASRSAPAMAVGLALMVAGALLGLGGLRLRRTTRPASASRA